MSQEISLGDLNQFGLNSKIGNSMKDNQLRIKRHIEHINGKKVLVLSNSFNSLIQILQRNRMSKSNKKRLLARKWKKFILNFINLRPGCHHK